MAEVTPGDEHGFTLVELLAAMLVGTVVLLALFGLVDLSTRQHATTVDRMDTLQRGRLGVDLIGQRLRLAVCPDNGREVFTETTETQVTFYAQQAPRPTGPAVTEPKLQRRTILLTGTTVEERVYDRTATSGDSFPATPTTTTVLARDVRVPAGKPFLEYRAPDGSPLTTSEQRRGAGRVVVNLAAIPRRADERLGTVFESTTAIRSDDPTDPNPTPEC